MTEQCLLVCQVGLCGKPAVICMPTRGGFRRDHCFEHAVCDALRPKAP